MVQFKKEERVQEGNSIRRKKNPQQTTKQTKGKINEEQKETKRRQPCLKLERCSAELN